MTTSKGIILLLLEQNSVPLLVPGWGFSPKKIGWRCKFTLFCEDLKAKCTCLIMELPWNWKYGLYGKSACWSLISQPYLK